MRGKSARRSLRQIGSNTTAEIMSAEGLYAADYGKHSATTAWA